MKRSASGSRSWEAIPALVQRNARRIVGAPAAWADLFAALVAIVTIRTVLELLLDSQHRVLYYDGTYLDLVIYANAFVSWLGTAALMWLIVRLWLPLDSLRSARLVCGLLPIIWIVPPVNWLATRGAGGELYYGQGWTDFLFNFVNLFNPTAEIAMAPAGVRLEILLIFLGSFLLTPWAFGISRWRALGLAVSLYAAIFTLGYLPAIQALLGSPAPVNVVDYFFLYLPLLLLLAMTAIAVLRREGRLPPGVVQWLLYPSRLLFYLFLVGFGFFYAGHPNPGVWQLFRAPELWHLLSAWLSVILLFAWARITNDRHDVTIDQVSNASRPIVAGIIDRAETGRLGRVFLGLSFLFAIPTDASFIPFWGLVAALSYVYSAPPIRLRRFYPAAPVTLAVIGSSLFCAGASLVHSTDLYAQLAGSGTVPAIFLAFFFLCHLKDLKDLEGDRADGVHNVFNWVAAKRTLGASVIAGFTASVLFLMRSLDLLSLVPLTILGLFLLASLTWTFREPDLRRVERVLLFALVLFGLLSAIWLVDRI